MTPCRWSGSARPSGRSYCLHLQALKMKAIRSLETWGSTRPATRRHTPLWDPPKFSIGLIRLRSLLEVTEKNTRLQLSTWMWNVATCPFDIDFLSLSNPIRPHRRSKSVDILLWQFWIKTAGSGQLAAFYWKKWLEISRAACDRTGGQRDRNGINIVRRQTLAALCMSLLSQIVLQTETDRRLALRLPD